jgi:uncharacterized protein YuzE
MKIVYDSQSDVLSILLQDAPIDNTESTLSGMKIDYDSQGNAIKLEISNASDKVTNPFAVEYTVELSQKELKFSSKDQSQLTLSERRGFFKLPIAERRRILAQQAEELTEHYQQNTEWQE